MLFIFFINNALFYAIYNKNLRYSHLRFIPCSEKSYYYTKFSLSNRQGGGRGAAPPTPPQAKYNMLRKYINISLLG